MRLRGSSSPSTPWRRRTSDGIYFGDGGSVEAYFALPLTSLHWEDAIKRLSAGTGFNSLLTDIGETTVDLGGGIKGLALRRSVHIFAAGYENYSPLPDDATPAHRSFLMRVSPETEPAKVLLLGVKLWPAVMRTLSRGSSGSTGANLFSQAKAVLSRGEGGDAFAEYIDDYREIRDMVLRAGGRAPEEAELQQLESWFNNGKGPDVPNHATPTSIHVNGRSLGWELGVISEFTAPVLPAPQSQWLLDAMTHVDPAAVVSIRGDLTPASVIRAQLRTSQRRLRANEEEEAKTSDISRDEIGERARFAKELENTVQSAAHAWLTDCSIVMAREQTPFGAQDTYLNRLKTAYGIEGKVLEHRQLELLDEMQPCSTTRANPFRQVLNPAMIAYAGLPAFSHIGEKQGVWMGREDPDYTSVLLDLFAASHGNKPPAMAIFGDPGSGKAQPLTAKLLTPNGWKLMGQMCVGDLVIGSDGQAHKVLGVYPQGIKPVYRVSFSDGSSTEATGDHLWNVTSETAMSDATHTSWTTLTTDELRDSLRHEDGRWRWRIPLVAPIDGPATQLDADPYELAFETGAVPVANLRGSRDQRFALLQGLLDRDGLLAAGCGVLLPVTDPTRADRILELVQSLGGTARVQTTSSSADGVRFTLTIVLPESLGTPFRDADKAHDWHLHGTGVPVRHVVDITYVRDDEAQCIAVTAPDSLYVTDDHVVTHNTFAAQLLAGQAALSGVQTILINPKGFDSLSSFVDWVGEHDVPARVISMQSMEQQPGAFDFWRFVEPEMAAELLTHHITTVLGSHAGGLSMIQEVNLGADLKRGAQAGARCAAEAMAYVQDAQVANLVLSLVQSSSLFALGFGMTPQEPLQFSGGGLTLIEFERALNLPGKGKSVSDYEREERIAVGAMRLVTRAALEILMSSNGGVLVVDEAHHYLGSPEGLQSLQRMGREGRSQKLLPIFLTQRVSDLLGADMESYLSRVLVMKLTDEKEARAALKLCGLEATQSRIEFLREAGPRRSGNGVAGRGALGFFRDPEDGHSVIEIGPVPEDVRLAFSTNPADKAKRAALLAGLPIPPDPTDTPDTPDVDEGPQL